MRRLAIIGSGDLGQQIAYHAAADRQYNPVGFFDDFEAAGVVKNGIPVLGHTEDIFKSFADHLFDELIIAIGYKHLSKRAQLFDIFNEKIPFATLIHSSSYVDKSCTIGKGVFIYPGCVLDMNVRVDHNTILNVGCVIAHDSQIGRGSFLSPGVHVAGFVNIGDSVTLGIGTVVVDNINIEDGIKTGAGAVVIDSLTKPGLYVGVPAQLKKALRYE